MQSFNPLVDGFERLSVSEIDQKIQELSKKYWQTRNPQMQQQIAAVLEMYQHELQARQAREKLSQDQDDNLDNLINIS